MPKRNSKFQVLPLKVLARARVSLNRAKDIDFNFMELIANGVEELEYNGYNTTIASKAGQKLKSRTYITYFPQIRMNPAEPDTISITMHIVKIANENSGQIYTAFSEAFGGVDKMLPGKNFPSNRALRIFSEEFLIPGLLDCVLPTFDDHLGLASKRLTAKLWLDGLAWPVFIALKFIIFIREGD